MSKSRGKSYEKRRGISFEFIKQFIPFIMIVFILFIVSGGIYVVIENPPSLARDQSGVLTFIYPGPSDQTSSEFVLTFLLFSMTLGGGFLIYNSSRTLYSKQSANTQLVLGILLFTVGFMILLIMAHIKDPQYW